MCKRTITSEFVSYGHPDKMADQVSDALVDEFLKQDPNSRTGIEVLIKDNVVVLGGEVNSRADVNCNKVVRDIFDGFIFPDNHHLSPSEIKVINLIGKQSPEIHQGVDKNNDEIGAGDQGFCVGFASNETEVYLPLGYYLAKKICQYIASLTPTYGPDVKTQVTVEYDEEGHATLKHILVSTMHQNELEDCRIEIEDIILNNRFDIPENLFNQYFDEDIYDYDILVNPCGEWRIGGPVSDCGVTGRKIVVDAYGGYCNVGGGAYSGKDHSKVDRSAAYMARYLAKNIVATGLCNNAKVELSYAISVPEPTAINVVLDTNCEYEEKIVDWIKANISLTPKGIDDRFYGSFPRNFYLARNGHYGYDVEGSDLLQTIYPWERIDFAERLKLYLIEG